MLLEDFEFSFQVGIISIIYEVQVRVAFRTEVVVRYGSKYDLVMVR